MAEEEQPASKFNINMGGVSGGQVVIGDYNTVAQRVGLTPQETAELKSLFATTRSEVEAEAPPERREEALAQTEELERAVLAEQPDPGRIQGIIGWFKKHAPQVAGTIVSMVATPIVGKVVEAAGEAIAGRFREVVEEEL
jgi:hypothetical protein